jgi:hypothetical protein
LGAGGYLSGEGGRNEFAHERQGGGAVAGTEARGSEVGEIAALRGLEVPLMSSSNVSAGPVLTFWPLGHSVRMYPSR